MLAFPFLVGSGHMIREGWLPAGNWQVTKLGRKFGQKEKVENDYELE